MTEILPKLITSPEVLIEEPRKIRKTSERAQIASQMMAAILMGANTRGSFPNAEMIAKEAVKYADALWLELEK